MGIEVKVPVLGESVTEATIGEWLKQPGDAVAMDEPIASLETDKVAVEVPAPNAGVMGEYKAAVGDTVEVGTVIATIEEGTGTPSAAAPAKAEAAEPAAAEAPAPAEEPAPAEAGAARDRASRSRTRRHPSPSGAADSAAARRPHG